MTKQQLERLEEAARAAHGCIGEDGARTRGGEDTLVDPAARAERDPSGAVVAVRRAAREVWRRGDAGTEPRGAVPAGAAADAERYRELEETTRRQARLIEELVGLGWPSSDARGGAATAATFDLGGLVERAVSKRAARLEALGVEVTVTIGPGPHDVLGHEERIALVVDGLILESLDRDPRSARGALHVALEREGDDEVSLTISGPRAAAPPPSRGVARAIVLVHGGTLDSTDDVRGTTHRLLFPRHPRTPAADDAGGPPSAAGGTGSSVGADLHGLRVLLVEGDAASGEHLLGVLRAHGADAVAVTRAAEALEAVRERPPDVLVSEIRLPDRDGYALIREVRSLGREHGGAVPAVALTGYASIEEGRNALAAGFQLHVAKPVDDVLFTHAVANVAGAPITELVV